MKYFELAVAILGLLVALVTLAVPVLAALALVKYLFFVKPLDKLYRG